MKLRVNCSCIGISIWFFHQIAFGCWLDWLKEPFTKNTIALDLKLKNLLDQMSKDIIHSETLDAFSWETIISKKDRASYITQLIYLSSDDRKFLLWNLYNKGSCPRNQYALEVLIALLHMVMNKKITEDSPGFDPNTKLFNAEIERLTKIAKEL